MNPSEPFLDEYVLRNRQRLFEIIQALVRIPSENTPPTGEEGKCQSFVADFMEDLGWQTEIYHLGDVPELESHPLFWPGRDYSNRPNVVGSRAGGDSGRSLILSGHIDTVPRGSREWTVDPFGGFIEGNRLYGRGSNDMKAGVGISLFVAEALKEMNVNLAGDLMVESVVDEEFGGVNGTLAGRLKGFNGDAAIIGEPTFLKVCPAQLGGHFAQLTFASSGGILLEGGERAEVVDQVREFLVGLKEFGEERRRSAPVHDLYRHLHNPVPVLVTKIYTGPWGNREPVSIPDKCQIEVYWQAVPGEEPEQVQNQFVSWLDDLLNRHPQVFPERPKVEFPLRWLPGAALEPSDPLVREFLHCARAGLENEPQVVGLEAPCDMYVFHEFGIPALLWGPSGGNTHTSDEYLELDSAVSAARVLLRFVCHWCGVQ